MRSWLSGRKRRSAKALILRGPKVRILPSAPYGRVAEWTKAAV